ncbi:MAG: LacI family DNA-binding transcriptional regulator [Peptoniphilaceae bacterium]|nr:LacI family DNA-binding transcriptional regulator [Peptoniphilaceae bacterium]MDY5765988.1 LacI family DNA-binding transcriptional regulator [Peptoniphilaceae bacterium]
MAQPTIKDVAKLAGVSISTVSRVMNKSKPVSPEAERKVIDAINKLGFKPNELARSLVMKHSNSIGILVKDIGIEYMADMIRGAEEIGRMYNYDILLSSTYGELELEKKEVDFLFRKQVEGMIIISENINPEIIIKVRDYHIPYILLDHYYKSSDYHTVSIDYHEAMYQLTEHLLKQGNKNIWYLRSNLSYDVVKDKLNGYEDAMEKAHLMSNTLEARGITAQSGYDAIERLGRKSLLETDVIIAETDELAIGVFNYCYEEEISIPESVQIAGFGSSKISQIIRPRLTSVNEPYYDIGAVAMRMLTKELQDHERISASVTLPTQLFIGESTKNKQ